MHCEQNISQLIRQFLEVAWNKALFICFCIISHNNRSCIILSTRILWKWRTPKILSICWLWNDCSWGCVLSSISNICREFPYFPIILIKFQKYLWFKNCARKNKLSLLPIKLIGTNYVYFKHHKWIIDCSACFPSCPRNWCIKWWSGYPLLLQIKPTECWCCLICSLKHI